MPSLLDTLSLVLREFWRILTRQHSTTLVNGNGNIHKGVRKPTTTRQPPPNLTRFSWTYLLVLFSCGCRRPRRGDSSFYVDGDLEAGQGSLSSPQDERKNDSCEGEFVDIDLNDGKPPQRPRGTSQSQSREPSSFMPPKFYFPVPIPSIENDQQQQQHPSPPPLVLSDILDQFPLPPTSHPRIHKNDIIRGDSNLKRFPRPLTPIIDFDASSSSFSSEFESMLSLSYDSSTSSSCFSPSSSPPATPLSPLTPTTPVSPWIPATPLRAVLPAWCDYQTSNIAKREEAYRKMRLKKKKLGEREEVERARDDDGSLLRSKSPAIEEGIGGHCAKKPEQTANVVQHNARHGEKDARLDVADNQESQDETDTLRNFKILHKPTVIRPPLRVFIPGHKRSTKRGSANGSLSRLKSPAIPAELEGYGGQTHEQTVTTANHSKKVARLNAADLDDRSILEAETLRNFKILPPKPIRPPLRVFIPGHKRSPPIFTLPEPNDLFIKEEDTEDAYADQSYVITQTHDHHAQDKPTPRVLPSESHVQLRRTRSDAKHDMSNVLRAFNEMVLGTEEDFRTLFEGESLSTSLSLVSSVLEERNILTASLSRSRSRGEVGKTGRTRTSMASRLARARSCAYARTQGSRNGDGDGGEETSSDEDEFDEEKMAPGEWFDMLGLDEYLA